MLLKPIVIISAADFLLVSNNVLLMQDSVMHVIWAFDFSV